MERPCSSRLCAAPRRRARARQRNASRRARARVARRKPSRASERARACAGVRTRARRHCNRAPRTHNLHLQLRVHVCVQRRGVSVKIGGITIVILAAAPAAALVAAAAAALVQARRAVERAEAGRRRVARRAQPLRLAAAARRRDGRHWPASGVRGAERGAGAGASAASSARPGRPGGCARAAGGRSRGYRLGRAGGVRLTIRRWTEGRARGGLGETRARRAAYRVRRSARARAETRRDLACPRSAGAHVRARPRGGARRARVGAKPSDSKPSRRLWHRAPRGCLEGLRADPWAPHRTLRGHALWSTQARAHVD
jgi:hypothetical protein